MKSVEDVKAKEEAGKWWDRSDWVESVPCFVRCLLCLPCDAAARILSSWTSAWTSDHKAKWVAFSAADKGKNFHTLNPLSDLQIIAPLYLCVWYKICFTVRESNVQWVLIKHPDAVLESHCICLTRTETKGKCFHFCFDHLFWKVEWNNRTRPYCHDAVVPHGTLGAACRLREVALLPCTTDPFT